MVGELLALRVRVMVGVNLVLEVMVVRLNIVVIAEVAVFVGVKLVEYVFVGVKLLLGAMVVRLKIVVIAEVEPFV